MNTEQDYELTGRVLTDEREKPLTISISNARKIIVWLELAARNPAVGYEQRRWQRQIAKQISAVGAPLAGHTMTGIRSMNVERKLLTNETEITVPLKVKDCWIILSAAHLCVRHPGMSEDARGWITDIGRQIQAGIVEDIPEIAALAERGWTEDAK